MSPVSGLFGAVLFLFGVFLLWRHDSHVLGGIMIMIGTLFALLAQIFI